MTVADLPSSAFERFDVGSADGTSLAVWARGRGTPIVLVHGSMNDHSAFGPSVETLVGEMTVFAMDRRGFGASGDTVPVAPWAAPLSPTR